MLFDQLCDIFRSGVVKCYSIGCVSFSISCGYMLFDQLCDIFRSVVVKCYSISCASSVFDQLWLHVNRSVACLVFDQLCPFSLNQLWLHVIRSVVSFFDQLCPFSISCCYMLFDQLCPFSISCCYMLFDQLCDVFRSVVVTCYSISCVTFFDQLYVFFVSSKTKGIN